MKRISRLALAGMALLCLQTAFAAELSSAPELNRTLDTPAPTGGVCGTMFLTQSTSQVPVAGNSVSCNAGGLHAENSYYRVYDSSAFPAGLSVCEIQVGIEQAVSAGAAGQPLTVNVHAHTGAAFPSGTSTQIGSVSLTVSDQALSVLNVPLTAALPAGASLVVEVLTPNAQTAGHTFFMGSNGAGQTAPSYIRAPDCGLAAPGDLASIGFPSVHWVLNARGTPGLLAYTSSPASLTFNGIVGQPTAAQSVTVTADAGNSADLSISSCSFSGANAADFAFSTPPSFPIAVAAGASVQMPVRFTGAAAGSRTASLDCVSNGVSPGPNFSVALSGTAAAAVPVASLSAASLDFGTVAVGQAAASANQVITNTGNVTLSITSITAPTAPFSLAADACTGQSLAPMASCTLSYGFAPTAAGPFNQNLSVSSNAAAAGFALTGTGSNVLNYAVSPGALSFSGVVGQPSAAQNVSVAAGAGNTASISISSCSFSGANAADFAFSTPPSFPIAVAAGASVQMPVRFTGAAAGSRTASLDCVSNGVSPGPNFSVALSGSAAAAVPVAGLSTPALQFGTVTAGQSATANLTVTNTGNVALLINAITAPAAPFRLVSNSCTGQSLAPLATCVLSYAYEPTVSGPSTQSLGISSNGAAVSFSLNGSATQARPAVVPATGSAGLLLLMLAMGGFGWARLRAR